jgi:hypothetical protein
MRSVTHMASFSVVTIGDLLSSSVIVVAEVGFLIFLKYLWVRVSEPRASYLFSSKTLRRLFVLELAIGSVASAAAALAAIARG